MAWRAEALLVPTYYTNKGVPPRTVWTEEGRELVKSKEYKNGKLVAKPGVHHTVVDWLIEGNLLLLAEYWVNLIRNTKLWLI